MSGIAGVAAGGERTLVEGMLAGLAHRGPAGSQVTETGGATLGLAWTQAQSGALADLDTRQSVCDEAGNGHFAEARVKDGRLVLMRDQLGVAPLYYGHTAEGDLCFASEVKALLTATSEVHEMPPGHRFDGERMTRYFELAEQPPLDEPAERVAAGLRKRLDEAVARPVSGKVVGSWLSGGLDSSTLAALACGHATRVHTFAAGLPGAPDLEHARVVAEYIGSDHHEVVVDLEELLSALPTVIYHLESFDALLVRSSLMNYLVAGAAADYVGEVLSGEAGDELFAGYAYLKSLDLARLPAELVDIAGRLHNTALQRVDRSASAHGTVAHVPFTNSEVVDYALRIPAELKLRDGVEKWILRQAMSGALPESVLERTKAKFWQGAGVGDMLAAHAATQFSDAEFERQRSLPNGWVLASKEELLYYQIFQDHFGRAQDLDWMGRTKTTPA